jgi:hypothetical protein
LAFVGDCSALQLVKGRLVLNLHEVQVLGAMTEEFEDERMQYAIRGLLIEDKGKMGVALLEFYMPEFV